MTRTLHRGIRVGVLLVAAACASGALRAQVAEPNAAGVAMGHVHYVVKDVAASRAFWVALGGLVLAPAGGAERIEFPDVAVYLTAGAPAGGSDGAVVNHVAFRVPSFASVEAAGLKVTRLQDFPGVGSTNSPDGERIELFEDAATNLTFAPDVGPAVGIAMRHQRPVGRPIAFHHIHLYLPDDAAVSAAKAWYAKTFGGVTGKRSRYDAVDLPGVNFNFSVGPKAVGPTRGRVLDHLAFQIRDLAAFCSRLARDGASLEGPCSPGAGARGVFLTDPWGTSIELTQPSARP
jgi:catechol 2,3-dioxygenase-like lactoylglutathione lyase family enzyme